MEKATNYIKDPKIRTYFNDITEGKTPTVELTSDEIEQGVNEFNDGMLQVIDKTDKIIF